MATMHIDESLIERWYPPLPEDRPDLVCCVCHESAKKGDVFGLLPIQRWGSGGPSDMTVQVLPVHRRCYEPGA